MDPVKAKQSPSGSSTRYTATIGMSLGNPGLASIPVVIPIGTRTRIHAWLIK